MRRFQDRASRSARSRASSTRWVAVGTIALFSVYALTTATDRVVNDVLSSSLASWRLVTTGQPWFDHFDLAQVDGAPGQQLWTGLAANGHVAVFRSPGAIAVGLPAYAAARLLGADGTAPGDFSLVPQALWAALLATASLVLFWYALRAHMGDLEAGAATLAMGLTTPMWSVDANSLWTHSLTVLGIAGMAWATATGRWWIAGVFGGLALWARLHTALVVAVLGVGLAVWRRRPSIAVAMAVPSGALLAGATGWSAWMYGRAEPQGPYPSPAGYAEAASGASWLDHLGNEAGLWVSFAQGMLVWTPALLVLLHAVVRSWPTLPDWTRLMAGAGVAYALVQGMLNGFTGGTGFYSYRLMLETLACVFPAFALSVPAAGPVARRLLGPVLGLQLAATMVGAVSETFWTMPRDGWTDNGFAMALRAVPSLWLLTAACVLAGHLAGGLWLQRRGDAVMRTPPREPAPR